MNEREVAEIRRRMRPEKNNIGRIRGCYVNDNHSIISEFNQNLSLISSNESEEVLSHFRKIFSGSIGRNLIDISFSNQQVLESDEHKLLSDLRSSSLSNDEAVKSFFEKTVNSLNLSGSYMILLASDKYDIFTYDENGEKNDSTETFSYIVCAICPIKTAKPSLGYSISENKFKNILRDAIVSAPSLGFMFPAFDSRSANIYQSLFYTQDISCSHEEFTNAIFNVNMPAPAAEQTESMANILGNIVAEKCDMDFIQSIQGQLIELTADHKNNKDEEPLSLSSGDIDSLMRFGGADEETVSSVSEKFKEEFGENATITPSNIMDIKKFEVKTEEVTLKVKPEHSDLISTRIIDGTKYILIRADNDIVVNGVKININ